jgi:hypothetical protein
MSRAGSTNGEKSNCWETQRERDNYEDQDVDGWIILKLVLREI